MPASNTVSPPSKQGSFVAYLHNILRAIDAMQLRERILLVVTVGLLLIVMLQMGWADRIYKKRQQLLVQIDQVHTQSNAAKDKLMELQNALDRDPNKELINRMTELNKKIDMVEVRMTDAIKHLMKPEHIIEMLRGLVAAQPNLTLVRVETLPPKDMSHGHSATGNATAGTKDVDKSSGKAKKTVSPTDRPLYRHGLEIEIIGDYQSISRWLMAIERMPMNIQWDNAHYVVEKGGVASKNPRARFTLLLYTISTQKEWLRV